MKRTVFELLTYAFAVMFCGAGVWAIGTHTSTASVTALIVTATITIFFNILSIRETIAEIHKPKRKGKRNERYI